MRTYKRFLTLKNEDGKERAILKAEFSDREQLVSFYPPLASNGTVTFYNGKEFEKHAVNGTIALRLDVSEVFCAYLETISGDLYGSFGKRLLTLKEFIDAREKSQTEKVSETEEESDEIRYDDERIASYDYYEAERLNGKDNDHRYDEKACGDKGKQAIGKSDARSREDDENCIFGEEQDKGSSAKAEEKPDRETLYESRRRKTESGIDALIASCPEEREPSSLIFGGAFARVREKEKSFIVGRIPYRGKTYYCVGVDGRYGDPPKEFSAAFFLPRSPFSPFGEGYYLEFLNGKR